MILKIIFLALLISDVIECWIEETLFDDVIESDVKQRVGREAEDACIEGKRKRRVDDGGVDNTFKYFMVFVSKLRGSNNKL